MAVAVVLVLLVVVLPILEIAVMVMVADQIGFAATLALIAVVSLAGLLVVRREGLGVTRRLRATVDRGELPTREVLDGALLLLAGGLLLIPGLITDVVGIALLIPPIRSLVRSVATRRLERRVGRITDLPGGGAVFGAAGGRIYTGPATYDVITTREVPSGPADAERG